MRFRARNVFHAGVALLAVALFFGAVSPASATLFIVVTDSNGDTATGTQINGASITPSVTFATSANGPPLPNAGLIFTGSIGNYTFTVTAKGSPSYGPAGAGFLDLNFNVSSNASATSAASLTVTEYQTGYVLPPSAASASATIATSSTVGPVSETTKAWFDASNTGNASAPPAYSLPSGLQLLQSAVLTPPPTGLNNNTTTAITPFSYSNPPGYALILQQVFNLGPTSTTTGDQQVVITSPAPAGLVLALTGLPCLAVGSWIRRRLKIA